MQVEIEPVVAPVLLSAPMLAMFTMEILKYVYRKWIAKNPEHDFPPVFYNTLIPLFTGAWGYLFAYVGWGEPVGFDLITLLQWTLASLITVAMYWLGLKPLKSYARAYREKQL